MTIRRLAEHSLGQLRTAGPPQRTRSVGHAHFYERALTRGALLRRAAGAGGAVAASALWLPALARAGGGTTSAAPLPVPANPALGGLHINLPGENAEPSTISNLNGFVGIGTATGAGTATRADGSTQRLFFDVDNRFMSGEFVGADGRLHHGSFAFT
jgi:hypothetical protein